MFKQCDRSAAAAQEAAQALLVDLENANVPPEVRKNMPSWKKGVSALDAAIVKQHEAIAAATSQTSTPARTASTAAEAELQRWLPAIMRRERRQLLTPEQAMRRAQILAFSGFERFCNGCAAVPAKPAPAAAASRDPRGGPVAAPWSKGSTHERATC